MKALVSKIKSAFHVHPHFSQRELNAIAAVLSDEAFAEEKTS